MDRQVCNKFGALADPETKDACDAIDKIASTLFANLDINQIRLAAWYLASSVDIAACETVLHKAVDMRKSNLIS